MTTERRTPLSPWNMVTTLGSLLLLIAVASVAWGFNGISSLQNRTTKLEGQQERFVEALERNEKDHAEIKTDSKEMRGDLKEVLRRLPLAPRVSGRAPDAQP